MATAPRRTSAALLDLSSYAAIEAVARLGRSAKARIWISRLAGDLAYGILPRRRRIALDQVAMAFPETSKGERSRIARESFRHFARVFFEVFSPTLEEMLKMLAAVRVEGLDLLDAALREGRGAIYVTGHYGNWELMAHLLALNGFPLSVLVRRTKNKLLDARLDRFRTATGNQVIDKDQAITKSRAVLRNGGMVGILMDQNVLGSKADFVRFFEAEAATTRAVGLLARRYRCPVLAGFAIPDDRDSYRVMIERVFPTGNGNKPTTRRITSLATERIERQIKRRPGCWLWSHDRFRTHRVGSIRVALRLPNWIGDAIMALPLVRLLSASGFLLTLIAREPLCSLFRRFGFRVMEATRSLRHGEEIIGDTKRRFRAILVLPRSFRAGLAARSLGTKIRVGYAGTPGLTHPVPAPVSLSIHQSDRYLLLADRLFQLFLSAERAETETVPRLPPVSNPGASFAIPLPDRGFAVLAPGAAYGEAKRYSVESFAEVGRGLLKDQEVIVLGGDSDRDRAEAIVRKIGRQGRRRAVSFAGRTTLPDAAEILSRASLLIANDSGLLHLAAALGTRSVGLFGPTDPTATAPRGSHVSAIKGEAPCSPCRYRTCPKGRICWHNIPPQRVLDAVRQIQTENG